VAYKLTIQTERLVVVYIRFTLNQSFSLYCEFVSHLVSTLSYTLVYIRFTLNQSFNGAHEVAYKLTIQTKRLVQSKTYVNYRV
jgi:hypothetical protein